jgi:L-threonylcarbamoyladenylate synthase
MTDFSNDIDNCLKVLNDGGIILYPTDTIWGIGCDATNENAVEKIIALKNRPQNKSFVVLVASEKDVLKHSAAPDLSVFDFLLQTNKPTTVIYENALGIAQNALAEDGSVAMRICKDEFCKHLIKRFRKPLLSTSANKSGETSPQIFTQISGEIKNGVDYVVRYKQDDVNYAQPSAIIRWENGKPIFLRK